MPLFTVPLAVAERHYSEAGVFLYLSDSRSVAVGQAEVKFWQDAVDKNTDGSLHPTSS